MSKDKALAFLKEHSPVVFSALQAGKYIQFDVLTFELWKEGYKMPYAAHYNVLHSPQGLILEVLPPCEAERIKAFRIATAEQLISDYLEQRKSRFEALHYPPAQAAEREAVERALTDPTALHIEAPAGFISPSHATPLHKSPANFIAAAYKRLTLDNYYSEIHAEHPRKITTYPLLMAEALRRYADWIDSKTVHQSAQISADGEGEQLPEFAELTGPITEALQRLGLLSDTGRYIGSKGQIKTLFNALERRGYLVGKRSTTEQFSKYFQTTFSGKVSGRALRAPLTIGQEEDLAQYKAALPKK